MRGRGASEGGTGGQSWGLGAPLTSDCGGGCPCNCPSGMATVPQARDSGSCRRRALVPAALCYRGSPAPVPGTRSSQAGVGCPGWLEDTGCRAGADQRRLPILTGQPWTAKARGLPRLRAAPSRPLLLLQRSRSRAESRGDMLLCSHPRGTEA